MAELLDASALLALVFDESGATEVASAVVEGCAMATANLAEFAGRLHLEGWPSDQIRDTFDSFTIGAIDTDTTVALEAAALMTATRPLGLGLGDRICLATARVHGLNVLTADKAWLRLRSESPTIRCIR